MDGVGARLGRSSARYAPTTVVLLDRFVGGRRNGSTERRPAPGTTTVGQLLTAELMVVTALISCFSSGYPLLRARNNNGTTDSSAEYDVVSVEEPPKRKFKYIPINVLEEQKNDASEQAEDDIKPIESDTNSEGNISGGRFRRKPPERQDLNERTLDLSLQARKLAMKTILIQKQIKQEIFSQASELQEEHQVIMAFPKMLPCIS
ncbi:hypothetical protein HAX54_032227 [Datura stramonium]|uniref:Uncharacterized protein n=1 Tax=Datura stramonium TaxID=4076 RepID=A0ABS8RPQ7_DATST|nr:hypothetical protein [Datura stramonium]